MSTAHNIFTGDGGCSRIWKNVHTTGPRGDYQVQVYRAHIRIGGRQHETSYSIEKHGSNRAHALAMAWLKEKRAEKQALRAKHERAQLKGRA